MRWDNHTGAALAVFFPFKERGGKKREIFKSGLEPETYRVSGGRDNQLHHLNFLSDEVEKRKED